MGYMVPYDNLDYRLSRDVLHLRRQRCVFLVVTELTIMLQSGDSKGTKIGEGGAQPGTKGKCRSQVDTRCPSFPYYLTSILPMDRSSINTATINQTCP